MMAYSSFIIPVVIFSITYLIARLVNNILKRSIQSESHFYSFNRRLIVMSIHITGLILTVFSIPALKGWAVSLMASVGILALVIGFAAKDIFANIIAGIFIAIFKPFKVGDTLSYQNIKGADGFTGTVEDINLRHTVVKTQENNRIIIPNSNLTATDLINHTIEDQRVRRHIEFSISYDSNLKLAKKIIKREILNHPNCLNSKIFEAKKIINQEDVVADNELLNIKVVELGDYGIKIRAWAWAENNSKGIELIYDVLESVKLKFDKEGIEIPYPYRTLILKKVRRINNRKSN